MKIKIILIIVFCSNLLFPVKNEIKAHSSKGKILKQANSLKKNGLIKESIEIYSSLFSQYPSEYDIYKPLKDLLINDKQLEQVDTITKKYIEANNNNLKASVNALEVFILLKQDNNTKNLLSRLPNNFPEDIKLIKQSLKILLNKNKINSAIIIIEKCREIESDFFSLELGMHYSMVMEVEKSLDEFFLYILKNPKQKDFIFNRILAMPDLDFIIEKTRNYLIKKNDMNSILLLSKIEFKQKKYIESYNLISTFKDQENYFIRFVEDLIKIKKFDLAQKVIKDILDANFSTKNLEKTILLLAQLFEEMLVNEGDKLFLINDIANNELLKSPFKKIDDNKSILLNKAINIYDSLSINTKQIKPLYHLAEINYKILNDLDNASILYNKIISSKNKQYYKLAIERVIDIMISKGELEKSKLFIENQLKTNKDSDIKYLLQIKELQILFYLNNIENLNNKIASIIKNNDKTHTYYNDILKIKYDIMLFDNNTNLIKYTNAMHKIFQNKRIEAINILESIINNEDELINNKMKIDCAHLYFEQGNTNRAIELIQSIDSLSPFKEIAIIFEAEIYDYVLKDKSRAAELYLLLLDDFKMSIYYESIRFRLRELAS